MNGINIWSGSKDGLGAALTNMTVLAKKKGTVQQDYAVSYKGELFADAEAAYQWFKTKDQWVDRVMAEIICCKFQQHPRLLNAVMEAGGIKWLETCSHFTGAKSARFRRWEGVGTSSRFIRNLIAGYLLACERA